MQQRETTTVPLLVLSTEQHPLRRIAVDKPRISIGRRPYNDVMLDDLTVSGEHAVLHTGSGETVIHDLNSRNGTLVNGVPVMQRALADGDRIEIGVYRLQFVLERAGPEPAGTPPPRLQVLAGARAGETRVLDRPIAAIDNGAGLVASIAHRRGRWQLTHLEGPAFPMVNGESIGLTSYPLRHGDLVELAGTIVRFLREPPA